MLSRNPLIIILFISLFLLAFSGSLNAETVTQIATIQFQAPDIFSLELVGPSGDFPNILYMTNIPFTQIDPALSMCYSDGRTSDSSKSDTGVLIRTNKAIPWYLKMRAVAASSPLFPIETNFKYYMGQPYNRNTGAPSDGTLASSPAWTPVPISPMVVYSAGPSDMNNLPYGTITTLSFSVNPEGLPSATNYIIEITYTLSASV